MSFDVAGIIGVAGLTGVGAGGLGAAGNAGVAQADIGYSAHSSWRGTEMPNAASGNFLLDGLSMLQVPEGLLTGSISAAEVAKLNVDVLHFTASLTASAAIRKEFSTAKTQLLSEGKQ
jgi:hypothetical protein